MIGSFLANQTSNMLKSRNRISSNDKLTSPRSSKNDAVNTGNNSASSNQHGHSPQSNTVHNTTGSSIRKRRSSINIYDQPSSLSSRLRQLETDMIKLDENRTKLYDDTHSTLAQYEIKLNEIQAILRKRQDNVEKNYVDDMNVLLKARVEFEAQVNYLKERHNRMQDKFTHRETNISREIRLMKNKFEALEKNRTFRMLLRSSAIDDLTNNEIAKGISDNQSFSSGQSGNHNSRRDSSAEGIRFGNPLDRSNKAKSAINSLVKRLTTYPGQIFKSKKVSSIDLNHSQRSQQQQSNGETEANKQKTVWRFIRRLVN